MMRPWIEPRSSRPLVNSLYTRPTRSQLVLLNKKKTTFLIEDIKIKLKNKIEKYYDLARVKKNIDHENDWDTTHLLNPLNYPKKLGTGLRELMIGGGTTRTLLRSTRILRIVLEIFGDMSLL